MHGVVPLLTISGPYCYLWMLGPKLYCGFSHTLRTWRRHEICRPAYWSMANRDDTGCDSRRINTR